MNALSRPLWLVGTGVGHSLSPAMHNAALDTLQMSARYSLCEATPDTLADALAEAERTCSGINVTAPHKLRVAAHFQDVLDDRARLLGAVNTVVFAEGKAVSAHNTDVDGLIAAWRRAALQLKGTHAAVFGAGGAARAVVGALAEAGVTSVTIAARRDEAARALVGLAERCGLKARLFVAGVGPHPALWVNAASAVDAADSTLAAALLQPAVVHDLRVGARAKDVRDSALRRGHLFIDGTTMLLHQGRSALAHFLGSPVPDAAALAMERALAAALRA